MSDLTPYDGPSEFVHLHCHTVYSTLDGVQTPEQLMTACAERKWPAIAVTEHGHMASVPDLYFAATKNGIKYIPGCEIYFNDYEPYRQRMQRQGGKLKDLRESDPDFAYRISRNRHLTVLAKNMTGFKNLVELTTLAWEYGTYYNRARIWFDKLVEKKEGLIILSGCLNGPVSYEINHSNLNTSKAKNGEEITGALDYVRMFREAFGEDYFIELQMPCLFNAEGGFDDYKVFWKLLAIANKLGIDTALANDAHYLKREDFRTQKLMMAIDQDLTIDSPDLFHVNSDEQFLKTRQELWHTFKTNPYSKHATDADFEAMCDNTLKIANRCAEFTPDIKPKVPVVDTDIVLLRKLVSESLIRKGLHKVTKKSIIDNKEVTYVEQAKLELDRFIEKGFASYFIITNDLIQYSISQGWPVGPRGSVGGSLVCYLLGIHELDPLKWGLSFDRFLSPSRGGFMLDIEPK